MDLYTPSIPVMIRFLSSLQTILVKGKRYAKARKFPEAVLAESRLAPDMHTLVIQVQYAYFTSLEIATNLSGREMPQLAYDEKTVDDSLKALKQAIAFLRQVRAPECAHAAGKRVKSFLDPKREYAAEQYLFSLALPNFYFHVTTAYDILRHLGLEIGKSDFLGLR